MKVDEMQKKFPSLKLDHKDFKELVGIWDQKGGNVLASQALKVFKQ